MTVTCGVPQALSWAQSFSSSTSTTDIGLNNLINTFADDTNIRNTALTDQDRRSLLEDLLKLSDWSKRKEMPFKQDAGFDKKKFLLQ